MPSHICSFFFFFIFWRYACESFVWTLLSIVIIFLSMRRNSTEDVQCNVAAGVNSWWEQLAGAIAQAPAVLGCTLPVPALMSSSLLICTELCEYLAAISPPLEVHCFFLLPTPCPHSVWTPRTPSWKKYTQPSWVPGSYRNAGIRWICISFLSAHSCSACILMFPSKIESAWRLAEVLGLNESTGVLRLQKDFLYLKYTIYCYDFAAVVLCWN